MKKNVASQTIGAQMVSATDGSAFTSAVTVYVTGDAGTQAIGSVGSGICTHEGNGFHSYVPAQAETNYDNIAFTFIASGAVPATVQVYTGFPQTGDSFARVGAPVGASISADIAAVQADTDNIQTRIPTALVSGRIDASVGAMATDTITSGALAASAVSEIQSGLSTLDAAGVRAAVGLASANLDTQLATLAGYIDTEIASLISSVASILAAVDTEVAAIKAKTDGLPTDPADASDIAASFSSIAATLATIAAYIDTEVAAIKAKTDNLPAAPAAVGDIPTANQTADALLDRTDGIETGFTLRKTLRLVLSSAVAKLSGAATTSVKLRDINDTKDRVTATVDADGNRTAITVDAT